MSREQISSIWRDELAMATASPQLAAAPLQLGAERSLAVRAQRVVDGAGEAAPALCGDLVLRGGTGGEHE
eukprot:2506150-Prymnesium_polylepis.1